MPAKKSSPQPFNIMLVDDNEDDAILIKHAFENATVPVEFQHAHDGVEALAMLRHEAPHADAPTPRIILLDLSLPRMDGKQLLEVLKQDENLKVIPTIVLTNSLDERDVTSAYRNHACAYMTKPIGQEEFAHRTECFVNFWLSGVAVIPHG